MSINNNDSKYNALTHWNLPTVIVDNRLLQFFSHLHNSSADLWVCIFLYLPDTKCG